MWRWRIRRPVRQKRPTRFGPVTHAILAEVVCGLYAGGLGLWFLLRAWRGDRLMSVMLANYLGVWLFVPALLLVPWALLTRHSAGLPLWSWRLAGIILVPVCLFLRFYASALIPRHHAITPEKPSFGVLTFNLKYGNHDFDAMLSVMTAPEIDILALQEVTPDHEAGLDDALSARYPHCVRHKQAGLTVYSRFPIMQETILPFEPWPALHLVLQIEGTPVSLVNAHLAPVGLLALIGQRDPEPARRANAARMEQVKAMLAACEPLAEIIPAIVACDCNMTELTSTYITMRSRLSDAFREGGWGFGHTVILPRGFDVPSPLNIPAQRIDYLFHSDAITVAKARVIPNEAGSDHRPLFARFQLNGVEE